jgi:hypothetical protein
MRIELALTLLQLNATECLTVTISVLYSGKHTGLSVLIKYKTFLVGSRRLSSRIKSVATTNNNNNNNNNNIKVQHIQYGE